MIIIHTISTLIGCAIFIAGVSGNISSVSVDENGQEAGSIWFDMIPLLAGAVIALSGLSALTT